MYRILLLTALILCMSFWIPADAAGPKQESSSVTMEEKRAAGVTHKLKANFRNCTVEEAFALIQQALDGGVNIIIHPSAKDVQVPAFTVRYANVLMITNIVCNLVKDLEATISSGAGFEDVEDIVENYPTDADLVDCFLDSQDSKDVPAILINLTDQDEITIERDFRVYGVSDILDNNNFTIHDIATTVETAWHMIPNNYAASLKFHEETGLLICSGTEQHIEILDEVISEMEGNERNVSMDMRMKQLSEEKKRLEHEIYMLKIENEKLRVELKSLKEKS